MTSHPLGAYLVDRRTHRVGRLMADEGPYLNLRPPGGGREWECPRDKARLATERELRASGVTAIDAEPQYGFPESADRRRSGKDGPVAYERLTVTVANVRVGDLVVLPQGEFRVRDMRGAEGGAKLLLFGRGLTCLLEPRGALAARRAHTPAR